MSQTKKPNRSVLSVRGFPPDLLKLVNRVAVHLDKARDEFVADLLRQDLKQFAAEFEAMDKKLAKWWEGRRSNEKKAG